MLVLLVIFMITAPLLTQGVNVALPQAAAKAIATKQSPPIIVSVDSLGKYYLNIAAKPEQALESSDLLNQVARALQQAKQDNSPRDVYVKGDRAVSYGQVVEAMVLLQQAGAPQVGLITQPADEEKK